MKIGSIVIRCYEFHKMVTFWQEALHYIPREPAKDGWVVLRDPSGGGHNVSLTKLQKGTWGNGVDCTLGPLYERPVERIGEANQTRGDSIYRPDDDFVV
jgi:hypothetical protein